MLITHKVKFNYKCRWRHSCKLIKLSIIYWTPEMSILMLHQHPIDPAINFIFSKPCFTTLICCIGMNTHTTHGLIPDMDGITEWWMS